VLDIDVVVGSAAAVLPGDECAAGAIGCDRGISLIIRGGAQFQPIGSPLGLLHEAVSLRMIAAMAVILAGVALIQIDGRRTR